jgi:peroxiredoxin (alkyl hydroperoxide reductase subunit C)
VPSIRNLRSLFAYIPTLFSLFLFSLSSLPLTVRSVFLIDPAGKIRLNLAYPHVCGRNWTEVLRCIDSIQLATANPIVTPCAWTPGDDVLVPPSVSTADAQKLYPDVNVWKPYFRTIPTPEKK